MRRALLTLALVLVLATAGCNSLVSPEPSPGPKTTTTALSGKLAPGLSADGFTDQRKLVNAHERILDEKSYTTRHRVIETTASGNVRGRLQTLIHVGANSSHFVSHTVQNGSLNAIQTPMWESSAWSNGTSALVAFRELPRPARPNGLAEDGASCFEDALCRNHSSSRRERSLHRR